MKKLNHLFEKNRAWANTMTAQDPKFFQNLADRQKPEYLWIGCSDSRVPANQIIDLAPGDVFVHRNIGNMVVHTDLNCLSVLQYAIEVLEVKHVIVCGHYGCGGITAALENHEHGLVDNWLRHIKDVVRYNSTQFEDLEHPEKLDLLCELNVKEQVVNVCNTTIVRNTWKRGHDLSVHGWIYNLKNGILKDLEVCRTGLD